jgi:DnaJ-class molecular chaperone
MTGKMVDDGITKLLERGIVALERIADAMDGVRKRLDKEQRCPGCLGTGVDYQKHRCYRCGGTGWRSETNKAKAK